MRKICFSSVGRHSRKIKPFTVPSPLAKSDLKRLIELSRICFSRQWNPGTGGNFSVREDGELCWVSASGKHKGLLQVEDFLPIEILRATAVEPCLRKPSDETALHCAIYRSHPATKAVLHVHTPCTVSLITEPLFLENNEMLKVFGLHTHEAGIFIPCIPNTQDMKGLGETVGLHLNHQLKVLVLEGHGVYAWGANPDEALYRIEALEYLCKLKQSQHSKSSL